MEERIPWSVFWVQKAGYILRNIIKCSEAQGDKRYVNLCITNKTRVRTRKNVSKVILKMAVFNVFL